MKKLKFIPMVLLTTAMLSGCTVFHTFTFPTDHTLYSSPPIDPTPFFISNGFDKHPGETGRYKVYGHRELVNLWTDKSTLVGEYWYKDVGVYEVLVFGCGASENAVKLADRLHVWITQNTRGIDYESWPSPNPFSFRFPADKTGNVNPPIDFSSFLRTAGLEKTSNNSFIKSSIESPCDIPLIINSWCKGRIDVLETWSDGSYQVVVDDHGCGGAGSVAKKLKLWIDESSKNTAYTYDRIPTFDWR